MPDDVLGQRRAAARLARYRLTFWWVPQSAIEHQRRLPLREESRKGVASGVLTAAAQVGTTLGLALIVPMADRTGWALGFAGAAAVAVAGIGLSRALTCSEGPHTLAPARSRVTSS